jgi:hypothetical protein
VDFGSKEGKANVIRNKEFKEKVESKYRDDAQLADLCSEKRKETLQAQTIPFSKSNCRETAFTCLPSNGHHRRSSR